MKKKPKIVIVMPAYNAERTISDTYREIPKEYKKHIILVSDASSDKTVAIAKKFGTKVFSHPNNLGYGGNQKTCYWEALKLKPDVVVMLHPDYQYDATMMPYLVQPILDGKYDFMFGSRIATKKGALEGGMPPLKYYVNRVVCLIQNTLLGVNFTEHFSGYRAYSAQLLRKVPFQRFSNDFVFDQEMTISSISHGMKIGEIPIPTRYHDKASSIRFLKGAKFILAGFITIAFYHLHEMGLRKDARFTTRKRNKKPADYLLLATVALLCLIPFFRMEQKNFVMPVLAVFGSLILYSLIGSKKISKKTLVSFSLVWLLFISYGFYKYPDRNLFSLSRLNVHEMTVRGSYLKIGMVGEFYGQKTGRFYFKNVKFYQDRVLAKISYPVEIAKYYSSEPRFLYSYFTLPFLAVGLLFIVAKALPILFLYLSLSMLFTLLIRPEFTIIAYFPLIATSIVIGIKIFLRCLKLKISI